MTTSTEAATFRDLHRGETILVCGLGRSLRELRPPPGTITIGVNDIGRHFDPTYLVALNARHQFSAERFAWIENSKARAVFSQVDLELPRVKRFARISLGSYGGTDWSDLEAIPYTQNSPYVAVCLALHMGARRIGLIGVDFTDHHAHGDTGRHPLADRVDRIDREYAALARAASAAGVELVNLSRSSRLTSLRKRSIAWISERDAPDRTLSIVSYATTPVAGVPALLADCITARTPHSGRCVWKTGDYGNGVAYAGGIAWHDSPAQAERVLGEADLVIVHNGKVAPAHQTLLDAKPTITMAHNYAWNVDLGLVERGDPGVVVGQYQATLPEFAHWPVVANPVPLWQAAHRPAAKGRTTTICFTPSAPHERFPPEHRLYWHGKGYQTTMQVLRRLATEHDLRLETTESGQVSHAQSLGMKARAHIVIDECVTGSYHRNSLEGLAAGCVVVNGVGLLPGVDAAIRRCAPHADDLPFEFATLDTLEQVLTELIALGAEALAERGRRNRAWLETHWDFAWQWRHAWRPVVERALNGPVTGAAPVSGPAGLPASRPAVASRPAKSGVSVVIPHGGDERLPQLRASLANLVREPEVGEVIVADIGTEPCAAQTARTFGAGYVFAPHDDLFERGRALNVGAALARYDLVLWKDNDLLVPAGFVARAASELRGLGIDHLLPYSAISYLSADDSDRVISGAADPTSCKPQRVMRGGRDCSGGASLIRRAFLLQHGGIPEGFRGWGGEDNAWMRKVQMLGHGAFSRDPAQVMFHLFHADSGATALPRSKNPYYADNVARLARLRAIPNAEIFAQLYPRDRRRTCPWDATGQIILLADAASAQWAATAAAGLGEIYGIDVAQRSIDEDGWRDDLTRATRIVCCSRAATEAVLADAFAAGLQRRLLAVTAADDLEPPTGQACLRRVGAGAVVGAADRALWQADGIWQLPTAQVGAHELAVAMAQPLSLLTAPVPAAAAAQPPPLPVWMYWEGPCPQWIRRCQDTALLFGGDVRILDRAAFDRLWDRDRDVCIEHLRPAQRADFIRAFLLARFGGIWLDSDCVVMRSLDEVRRALAEHQIVAHRDRQGYFPNGFLAARPDSSVAAAFYREVCARLRSGRPLGWISLGGEPLTEILGAAADGEVCELPVTRVQPICWSEPAAFFTQGSDDEHARALDPDALCYMLSNTEVLGYLAAHPEQDIMAGKSFFRFLLRRARGAKTPEDPSEAGPSEAGPSEAGTAPETGPAPDGLTPREVRRAPFSTAVRENERLGSESLSGPGSCLMRTAVLRRELPCILHELNVGTLLDAPCGDFHWMQHVASAVNEYVGVDFLDELVRRNQERYATLGRFLCADILTDDLPRADLILCRDALVHMTLADARTALRNFARSGADYLLATTFPDHSENQELPASSWRPLNLQRPPFSLPKPIRLLDEQCDEAGGRYADKSLGLWQFADLTL